MLGRFITISLVTIGVALTTTPVQKAFAYEVDTHAYLTHAVVDFYNQHYPTQKVPAELEPYLLDGSRKEDDNERPMNHFYDPVHDIGLHTPALGTWAKSKDWADDAENQTSAKYRIPATIASILSAIEERKLSLISDDTDFTWREAIRCWVNGEHEKAMFTLGHVLHLMEDASVPEHTRNDPHPQFSPYESWTKQFTVFNQDPNFASRLSGKQPLTFGTLGSAFDSMARYSNNNFYSGDTLNASANFEKPIVRLIPEKIGDKYYGVGLTTDGEKNVLVYYENFNGSMIFISEWQPTLKDPNNTVLSDYWSRLSVKAVQHGAGLVHLFFEEADRVSKDPSFIRAKNPSFLVRIVDHMGRFVGTVIATAEEFSGAVRDNMAAMGGLLTRLTNGENVIVIVNENPLPVPLQSLVRRGAAPPTQPSITTELSDEGLHASFPILPLISGELKITPAQSSSIPAVLGVSDGQPEISLTVAAGLPPELVTGFSAVLSEFSETSGVPEAPPDPYLTLFRDTGGSVTPSSGGSGSPPAPEPAPTSSAPFPPGPPRNLALVWDASPQDIIATWQDSEDPDTPTSTLVYRLSVNGGSSTVATSGIRIPAAYATAYTVSVTAQDPEGNVSTSATISTTTPAAPSPPVEITLFEVTDATTDSGFWGRGTDTAIDEIAERYVPDTAQRVCAAFHRVAAFSGPTDSVLLRLWTDGIYGTLLSSSTVPASAIPSSANTPTEFRFPVCVPLTAGATYWFHVTRTAPTAANGYISRFRNGDQFSNSSYWQLHKYTMDPFGWAEFVNREWSLTLVGYRP